MLQPLVANEILRKIQADQTFHLGKNLHSLLADLIASQTQVMEMIKRNKMLQPLVANEILRKIQMLKSFPRSKLENSLRIDLILRKIQADEIRTRRKNAYKILHRNPITVQIPHFTKKQLLHRSRKVLA